MRRLSYRLRLDIIARNRDLNEAMKKALFLAIMILGVVLQNAPSLAQLGPGKSANTGSYTAENHKINKKALAKEQIKQNVKVNRMLDKLTELQQKEVLEAEDENQKSRVTWNSYPTKKE